MQRNARERIPFLGLFYHQASRVETVWAQEFTHYLSYIQDDDFLGVQNYNRTLMSAEDDMPIPESTERTQMVDEY